MIVYLLYIKDSPEEREVMHLAGELEQLRTTTETVEADSRQGISLNEQYDLPQRPAVVVAEDDGTMIQRWLGSLPPASEISYYFHA